MNIRSVCQRERGSEARGAKREISGGADESEPFCGCQGKRMGEDTLEVMPPGCEEQMAMEGVERVQVVVAEAKIVV